MGKFIIRRFIGLIPTLFIVITVSFFIIRLAPGGPFDSEKVLPPEIKENIEKKYHFDEPLVMQYLRYMGDVIRLDLGPSFRYRDHDINFFIATSFPNSLLLGLVTMFFALLFGIFFGTIAALRQNTIMDYVLMSCAIVGISIPVFVIGPVLQYYVALKWKLVPTSGWVTGRNGAITLILPVISLMVAYVANIARLSRASTLEVLRSDYVRTARAKGLSESIIIVKHVLKGSLLPVVSYLGPALAAIFTGAVVIEYIFRIPGMGRYFIQGAFNRDYTMIMGVVIVYSCMLLLLNFIVDIIYGFLDPRISYS